MSTASDTQPSPPIFGTTASEFGKGVSQGHAVAKQGQAAIIGSFRFAKAIGQLVYWSIFFLLTGVIGWSVFFIRRRTGLMASVLFLTLGFLTLRMFGPNVASVQAGVVLLSWVLFMLTFGLIQAAWGLYRLFAPPQLNEHVHRHSPGIPNAGVEILWRLLPGRVRNSSLSVARELLALVLMALGLWLLDSMALAEDPEHASALYLIPLMSAGAMISLSVIDRIVAAYAEQITRDQLLDQQAEAERMSDIQGSVHEREVEGYVQLR